MGELLSGTSKSEDYDRNYPQPSLPEDVQTTARLLQNMFQIVGHNIIKNNTSQVELNIQVYWIEKFGIMHTEWWIKGLQGDEAKDFYNLTSKFVSIRTVRLVNNISKAGMEAANFVKNLLPIIDRALAEATDVKKSSNWEELVKNVSG